MATLNVGGRTVEVPDNLDLPQRQTARTSGPAVTRPAPGPQPAWRPTNPNVMQGVPSAEARAWEAGRAQTAPAVAPAAPATPATPAAQPARTGLRGAVGSAKNFIKGGAPAGAAGAAGAAKGVGVGGAALRVATHPLALAGAGIAGAAAGLQTDTEDYATRFGAEGTQPGVLRDVGVRTLGVGSDVVNALTFGGAGALYDTVAEAVGSDRRWGGAGVLPSLRNQGDGRAAQTPTQVGSQQPAATPAATAGLAGLPSVSATAGPGDITRSVGPDGRVTYSGGNVSPDARIYNSGGGLRGQANLSIVPSVGSAGGFAPGADAAAPAATPQVRHSGNDWEARNNLRSLAVSANSITNNGGQWDQRRRGDVSAARQAYGAALESDLKLQNAEPALATEMAKSDNTLRGQTLESNNRLAGDIYSADQRLRGQVYDANATAAAARAKAAGEAAGKQNDLDIENAKRTQEQVTIYGADGKPDMAATQRAVLAVDKILPGYSTMSEQARKEHSGDASAIANIFNRTRGQSELGVGQAIFGNTNPELDSMPNFQGGQLKRSGLTGGLPGGAGIDGYYMAMPDGREVALGKNLSERELQMLRHNAATGQWIPEKKKD